MLTLPNDVSVLPLKIAVKITRNINGKANVKKADAGFRQKARFVYFNWRSVRTASLTSASALDDRPLGRLLRAVPRPPR